MSRNSKKDKQNESHDWLGEAAECLVRYYFAKAGYIVFGSSKWGADCAIQDKESSKFATIEVRSSDRPSWSYKTRLEEKLKNKEDPIRPHILATVRIKSTKINDKYLQELEGVLSKTKIKKAKRDRLLKDLKHNVRKPNNIEIKLYKISNGKVEKENPLDLSLNPTREMDKADPKTKKSKPINFNANIKDVKKDIGDRIEKWLTTQKIVPAPP